MLEWTGPRPTPGIDPKKLPGVVQDDDAAEKKGGWVKSTSIGGYVGTQYLHDGNEQKGELSITFRVPVPKPGAYDVRLTYTANPNRATNVPVTIRHAQRDSIVTVNQQHPPEIDDRFHALGKFGFDKEAVVVISNDKTNGYVVVDAVQIVPIVIK